MKTRIALAFFVVAAIVISVAFAIPHASFVFGNERPYISTVNGKEYEEQTSTNTDRVSMIRSCIEAQEMQETLNREVILMLSGREGLDYIDKQIDTENAEEIQTNHR